MNKELEILRAIWVSKNPDYTDREIRDTIDLSIECVKFANDVLDIMGTFAYTDQQRVHYILDALCDKRDYPKLNIYWDQIVGNFS